MSFVLNDQVIDLARQVNRMYRTGLPLLTTEDQSQPIGPDDVLDPDQCIGPLDHPLVLAIMAAKDPFVGMSLAASVRMMPQAHEQRLVAEIVKLVGEVSRHDEVQETCYLAAKDDFAPKVVFGLRKKAEIRIDDARQIAMRQLIDAIKTLSDGTIVEEPFIDRLLGIVYRCDLRPDTFRNIFVKILLSDRIRARVKLMVIDRLHQFPIQARLELITRLRAVAAGGEHAFLLREIDFTLQQRGMTAPGMIRLKSNLQNSPARALAAPIATRPTMLAQQPPALKKPTPGKTVMWHEVLLRDQRHLSQRTM